MSSVKMVSSRGKEFILEQKSEAHIDSRNCVKCNKCHETCSVGRIEGHLCSSECGMKSLPMIGKSPKLRKKGYCLLKDGRRRTM